MRHIRIVIVPLLFFVLSCANRVSPTGGKKDETPPAVVSQFPVSGSTSFAGNEIRIRFNENVQLNDASSQLLISPPLVPAPEILAIKQELRIRFKENLQANTTYNLNFGNSLVDVNEGNALSGFQYVFSTGSVVDSLTLSGRVRDNFRQEPLKGIVVMVYRRAPDRLIHPPWKGRPDYYSRTGADGSFRIANLPADTFYILACEDKNANLEYDLQGEESIAFLNEFLVLPTDTVLELTLGPSAPVRQRLKSFKVLDRVSLLLQHTGGDSLLRIRDLENTSASPFAYSVVRGDSMLVFLPDSSRDSLHWVINDADSLHAGMLKGSNNKRSLLSATWSLGMNPSLGGQQAPLELVCSRPVRDSVLRVVIGRDSFPDTLITGVRTDVFTFQFREKWVEGGQYRLRLAEAAVKDYLGLGCDSARIAFSVPSSDETAQLRVVFEGLDHARQYLFELLDENWSIRRSERLAGDSLYFTGLKPGNVRLRLIEDRNRNGRYDTHDFPRGTTAEPVYVFPPTLQLRANWELEQKLRWP